MRRPTDPAVDLLFGLLALQNGLIGRDRLVAATRAWSEDRGRGRPLADLLAERGEIGPDGRAAVEAMVAVHLGTHGDAARSLAALPLDRDAREALDVLTDPADPTDPAADVATFDLPDEGQRRGPDSTEPGAEGREIIDPGRTAAYESPGVGAPVRLFGDGRRFRVLRPHARGGLGAVLVALDAELNREVALKQILDSHADDPRSRERFLLEAEITGNLEHPGIVPVYGLGVDPDDGRPYYAMRFIRGDTLKEAIDGFHRENPPGADPGRRSLGLRQLLRRFVDVCNAVDYAHTRGVIHRDLKPANIVLGKHGETLVVDWGLAKFGVKVEEGEPSAERPLEPSTSGGGSETLPGRAMGTPSYMSPEQARGDLAALGPRSDVYSLGATLYCLLAGRPPFEGDVAGVLRAVERGEFPPPRRSDPTVARPLEAICLKAMATDPGGRYPSPRALAGDVERWEADEPVSAYRDPLPARLARAARRHRTAVAAASALALAALAGLAVGNVLLREANRRTEDQRRVAEANSRAAEANSRKAEANYQLAREAVETFLGGVMNQRLVDEPLMAPLRRELIAGARTFYQEFVDRRRGDPGALADLAGAQLRLAMIARLTDGPGAAIGPFEQARDTFDRLSREQPDRAEHRVLLIEALGELAKCDRSVGRRAEAEAAWARAIGLGTALAAEAGAPTRARGLLARALGDRGDFLAETGRARDALVDATRAVEIAEALRVDRPDDVGTLEILAYAEEARAIAEYALDHFREALPWRERAVATTEALLARDRKSTFFRNATASRLGNLAMTHYRLRDDARAADAIRRAVAIYRDLAREHPSVVEYEDQLSTTLTNYSGMAARLGRPGDAEAASLEAIEVLGRLVEKHPEVERYRFTLASACGNEGNNRLARRQYDRALGWFDRSVAEAGAILARQPDQAPARRLLRNSSWGRADCLVALGRLGDALPAWDRGIDAADGTARLEMRLGRASTLALLGETERALAEADAVLADPLVPANPFLYAVAAKVPAAAFGQARRRSPDAPDDLASRAIGLLRRAERGGFFRKNPRRVPEYRDDPTLAPLRGREDFRLLMMDLAFPADPFAGGR